MVFLQFTHKKSCSLIFSFILFQSSFLVSFGQSPYELKTGRELTLLGAGALAYGTSIALGTTVDPLTPTEVSRLSRADVNSFDRQATYHWSTSADRLSDVTLAGNAALLGLVTIGGKSMRQDVKTVAVMFIETLALSSGIERTVKAITQRPRPFVYNEIAPLDEKLTRDASQSFFSGHATISFATAVFTGEVFGHYFPHSRLKPYVWIGSLGLATATSALRYEAGLHYPTDLITGALYGSLVGWGIPKLHQVKNQTALGRRLDVQPWSNGAANGIYMRLAVFSR
ncbi:phosphatase PAP2 family protein [Spirosoma aerophilum]